MAEDRTKFFAFLASRHHDHTKLRKSIWQLGEQHRLPVWVAEIAQPGLRAMSRSDQLKVADACMRAIAEVSIVIFVTDGSAGTHLDPYGQTLVASYVEMELFQAALKGKPVHVFSVGRIADDTPMGRLLGILGSAFPNTTRTNIDNSAALLTAVERLLRAAAREQRLKWLPHLSASRRRALVSVLGIRRHQDWNNARLWQELRFLDGKLDDGLARPDPDGVAQLLDEADAATGSEPRIARAWMAIRELMGAPFETTNDARLLQLWDRALGRWASWTAWYGLHAHLLLGHPAALGSLSIVRSRLEAMGRSGEANGHTASLNGAFASCYYSLSKMAPRAHAASYLARADRYLEEGLARAADPHLAGLEALRGSIALRRRARRQAVAHFETALALCDRVPDGEIRAAEIRAELGWAQVCNGDRRAGVANLRQGVREMTGRHDPGFVVRGRKKLALGLASQCHFGDSFAELCAARDLAVDHQLEGQLDHLLRYGSRIGDLLGSVGLLTIRKNST